jgi:hypothetical protein
VCEDSTVSYSTVVVPSNDALVGETDAPGNGIHTKSFSSVVVENGNCSQMFGITDVVAPLMSIEGVCYDPSFSNFQTNQNHILPVYMDLPNH